MYCTQQDHSTLSQSTICTPPHVDRFLRTTLGLRTLLQLHEDTPYVYMYIRIRTRTRIYMYERMHNSAQWMASIIMPRIIEPLRRQCSHTMDSASPRYQFYDVSYTPHPSGSCYLIISNKLASFLAGRGGDVFWLNTVRL